MLAISTPATAVQNLDDTVRLGGANRYGTAELIAGQVGCSSDMILASGENQPDALAAAALAATVDAPIVLTRAASLPAETAAAIGTCAASGAQTVHILGGEAAVSAAVADTVDAIPNVSVNRIAGANRFETAVEIANTITAGAIGSFNGQRTAILASGSSWVDALAAGPVAYRGQVAGSNAGPHPILLTNADALPAATDAALTSLLIQQVVIVGGEAVVSADVAAAVEAKGIDVVRVAGDNRYSTAAAVAAVALTPTVNGGFGFDGKNVGLANGTTAFGGFDALAAAPYLGSAGAPLVLTGSLPAETATFLTDNAKTIEKLHVLGGLAAVDADTQAAAEAAATLTTPTATLAAGEGQVTFTVEFSEPVLDDTVDNTDFGVARIGSIVSVDGHTPSDLTGTTVETATKYVLDVDDSLEVGDVVSVFGEIKTPDGRTVGPASVTVAADKTKPVATVLAAPNNNTFTVAFDEPVDDGSTDNGSYVATAGSGNAALSVSSVSLSPDGKAATVTVSRNLLPGDRVGVVAGQVFDLTGNNAANGVTITVRADNIAPSLRSVDVTVTDSKTASLIVDEDENEGAFASVGTAVEYTAKKAGADGNDISIEYVSGSDAAEAVSVSGDAIEVTTRAGGSTPAQVAAAVNANGAANKLVSAAAVLPSSTDVIDTAMGPITLDGGETDVTVVLTYSEVVAGSGAVGVKADLDDFGELAITPTVSLFCGDDSKENNGTSNVYTWDCLDVGERPGTGSIWETFAGDVTDLAGNAVPTGFTSVTLS